ncbi:MAG: 3-hydroxyisobutyrate dehydrogenase, partial [Paraglaciecola sp.]
MNMQMSQYNIAFIGLGNMGGPMALNLIKAGCQVTVFDLMPAAMTQLADQGATPAQSVEQACIGADVVISMLPAG